MLSGARRPPNSTEILFSSIKLPKRRPHVGGDTSRIGLAVLAVVLTLTIHVLEGGFLTRGNFDAILLNSFPLLIAGIAAAALLISGNVDLSIGGIFAFVSVMTGVVARDTGSPVLAVLVGIAAGTCLGLTNGVLVRRLSISPIIVTLGTAFVFRGLAYVVSDGNAVFGFPQAFIELGRTRFLGLPVQVTIALIVFAFGAVVLTRTVFGVRTFAIGGNAEAARLEGINVGRHVTVLYACSGLAVAIASILTTAQLGSGTANIALTFELDVLTAIILGGVGFAGGTGRPAGVLVGVMFIGILNAGMIFVGLAEYYQQITKGAVLLLALAADQIASHRRGRRQGPATATQDQREARLPSEPAEGGVEADAAAPGEVVLRCCNLSKSFGAATVVRDASLEVRAGEVVCLVGDNGAGKSTLIRMITGVLEPDQGDIEATGRSTAGMSPAQIRHAGVEAVYQDLALCPNLGAAYNLTLGNEPRLRRVRAAGLLDRPACERLAQTRLDRLGGTVDDLYKPVATLSGGQRQAVAIARVASDDSKLVILDEPTAALGVAQSTRVLALTRSLARRGAGVIMISHDVESVLKVADRVIVMHLGAIVFEGKITEVDHSALILLMAGLEPQPSAVRS